jgi:hypothetical protein
MPAPAIDALVSAVTAHVRAIRETAAACPAGGGPAWDALLQHYRLAPFDPRERAMIVQHMHLARGATPGEVRMALAALVAWANGEATRLAQDPSLAPEIPGLRSWIDSLTDAETRAYETSVGVVAPLVPAWAKPAAPAIGVGAIFANAQQTSKEVPWAGQKFDAVNSLTCVHCGGPQEKPMDFMCKYCRRPISGSFEPTR